MLSILRNNSYTSKNCLMMLLLSPPSRLHESKAGAHKNPISGCEHAVALEMPSRVLQGRQQPAGTASSAAAPDTPISIQNHSGEQAWRVWKVLERPPGCQDLFLFS